MQCGVEEQTQYKQGWANKKKLGLGSPRTRRHVKHAEIMANVGRKGKLRWSADGWGCRSVVSAGAAGARFPFPGRRNRTSQEWLWLLPVSLAAFGFDLPKKKCRNTSSHYNNKKICIAYCNSLVFSFIFSSNNNHSNSPDPGFLQYFLFHILL